MSKPLNIKVCSLGFALAALFVSWLLLRAGGASRPESRAPVLHTSGTADSPVKDEPLIDGVLTKPPSLEHSAVATTNSFDGDAIKTKVRQWATLHPLAAAAWVRKLPDGAIKDGLLEDVAIVWAEKDSIAALEWAKGLPVDGGRQIAVLATGYEAGRTDPTNAVMAAMALESGAARNQLILYAVKQWSAADPMAALGWVEAVKEGGLRDELFADLATAWAQQDGEAAAQLASKVIRQDAVHRRAVVAVVQRWAQANPDAARAWVVRLSDPALKSNCWEAVDHRVDGGL